MTRKTLRSRSWFDNPLDPGMTALYIERYMNFGLTREELQSGKPIVGIAQTGSDLSPCNRIHQSLAERMRAGIREACQSAFNPDPLSACKIDPPERHGGGCPGSQ